MLDNSGELSDPLAWIQILSNVSIWLAYAAMVVSLGYCLARRRVPFPKVAWLFLALLLVCGFSHLLEAMLFWWPVHQAVGISKIATSVLAWCIVAALILIAPRVLMLRGSHELAEQVGIQSQELREANRRLKRETGERKEAQREAFRLATIVGSSCDAIISKNLDGYIETWNFGAERLYGYQAKEIIGKHISTLVPEERRDELKEILEKLRSGIAVEAFETERIHKDGQRLRVWLAVSPVKDDQDRVIGASAIGRDVTGRKRLEEQIREREARVRSIVENVVDGIVTVDEEGLVESFNPAAESIFGYRSDEVIGSPIQQLLPEPFPDEHHQHVNRHLESGATNLIDVGKEATGRRRDGSTFPVDLAVNQFRIGERRYYTGIIRDITVRKRAEETGQFLARASAMLSSASDFESTARQVARLAVPTFADWCVVSLREKGGGVRLAAAAHQDSHQEPRLRELWENLSLSVSPDSVVGSVLESGQPRLIADVLDPAKCLGAADEDQEELLRSLNPQSVLSVPLKVGDDAVGAITFVFNDAWRRYTQEDIVVAEDLADRSSIALEKARLYDQIKTADHRKDEFLAMLAHELRNPLAPVRNAVELLGNEGVPKQAADKALGTIQRQVGHMARLVDDLLDLSRIMRGKIELRQEPVVLEEIIHRAVEITQPFIDSFGHQLIVDTPARETKIRGDSVRLAQVVSNLLNNAAKYTDPGGEIQLRCQVVGDQVEIRVRDNGVGIDPQVLPYLFDLFHQAEQTIDRTDGGLGIGLTLVRKLVERHGGDVEACSDGKGRGSEFLVRLPVIPDQSARGGDAIDIEDAASDGARILVVDDNKDAAEMLSMLLALDSHQVHVVHDGIAAISAAREFCPEIILLDIGLPGMTGHEVARELRQDSDFMETTLIAVTGYGQASDRHKSKEAGFDEHLTKPVSLKTLRDAIATKFTRCTA